MASDWIKQRWVDVHMISSLLEHKLLLTAMNIDRGLG